MSPGLLRFAAWLRVSGLETIWLFLALTDWVTEQLVPLIGILLAAAAVIVVIRNAVNSATAPRQTADRRTTDDFDSNQWLIGVAGESHRNSDGSSRQAIIKRCSVGEHLILVREPENRYDSDAVKVCRENGQQIGYLPRKWACRMAGEIDGGCRFDAELFSIHGGTSEKPRQGVVIKITALGAKPRSVKSHRNANSSDERRSA